MSRGRTTILAVVLCALAGAGAYLLRDRDSMKTTSPTLSPFAAAVKARPQLGVLFTAPSFDFVDQDGKHTKDSELRGRIWIADFIFTHCAGSCPKVTAKMIELQKAIDDPEVRFVSFSVDPERDDPATLKNYAGKNNDGEARWLLLRPPDRKAIASVAQHMMAVARSEDSHDAILHTDFFILIDHKGSARGLYDSKSADVIERLKTDVATVARQRLMEMTPKSAAEN